MWLDYGGVSYYAAKQDPDEYGNLWMVCDADMAEVHGQLRESIKKKARKLMREQVCVKTPPYIEIKAFDYYEACTASVVFDIPQEKEKENTMGIDQDVANKRDYLTCRAYDLFERKARDLTKKFHMDRPSFTNFNDILAALKAGNIEPSTYYWNKDGSMRDQYRESVFAEGTFSFIDPLKDEAGLKTARKTLDAAWTVLKDTINILTPEEGLVALQAFEAQTF